METIPAAVAIRLTPPRVSRRALAREALVQRLHDARHCRLVLLTAPAGYGKTTSMAQWRHRLLAEGARVAWVTLAAEDDTPHQLCARLDDSLQQAGIPGCGATLPGAGEGADARLLPAFVAHLASLPGEIYLMLDGLDQLQDPATLAFLQDLLRARLPQLHMVGAARAASALALARLRASQELAEIGSAELAFSLAETLAFVDQRVACRLAHKHSAQAAVDIAAQLQEITEGWPAGLALAAGSFQPAGAPAWPYAQPAALHAYWKEEVSAGLPPGLLDFMRRIAVPQRIDADLARALTGCAEAPRRLEEIAARGLFLRRADAGAAAVDGWYQFHPLWRAHLLHELAREAGDGVAMLHGQAAAWLDRRGMPADAIGHALQSGDFDSVLRLIQDAAPHLPGVSPLREILHWSDGIACTRLASHPALLLAAAWGCVVTVRPHEAERRIRQWQASAGPHVDTVPQATLMRATLASQHDDAPRVLALLDTLQDRPLGNPALELIRMSLATRCGVILGHQLRSRAPYRVAVQSGATEIALMGAGSQGLAAWLEGNAYEALRLGTEVLASAERAYGRRSIAASMCAVTVAAALYEQDRGAEASQVLAGRLQALRTGMPDVLIEAVLCHARLQWRAGARHEALAELAEAEATFHRRGLPRGVAWTLAEQLRLALAGKDLRHGQRLYAALDDLARQYRGDAPREQEIAAVAALARARLALASGEPACALPALDALRATRTASIRQSLGVTADLLQAIALDDLYRTHESVPYLESALAAGARLGLVRTFTDEGERVASLLASAMAGASALHADYLRRLGAGQAGRGKPLPAEAGAEAGAAAVAAAAAPLPPADAGKGRALTRREREILALLEQAMSNKRIALALNLSVDTVKWNLRQIYAKLNVSRRYDAILVARSAARPPG